MAHNILVDVIFIRLHASSSFYFKVDEIKTEALLYFVR